MVCYLTGFSYQIRKANDLPNFSQTCRQRKLKCDEEKPTCGQCLRGSRECRPSDGVVFRHQQNASMNRDKRAGESSGRLGSFYAYKDTFNKDNVWVDIPKNGTLILHGWKQRKRLKKGFSDLF